MCLQVRGEIWVLRVEVDDRCWLVLVMLITQMCDEGVYVLNAVMHYC